LRAFTLSAIWQKKWRLRMHATIRQAKKSVHRLELFLQTVERKSCLEQVE